MDSKGRILHAQAAKARETEQFLDSLTYNDDALFAYDVDNDALGFSEGIACRSITLRVYANLHDSTRLLTLAKYEMMASVDLARQSGDPRTLPMPLFNLAQIQEDLGELENALMNYREAVRGMETTPPERHKTAAILANMRVFLATTEYTNGDTDAIERAKQALTILAESDQENEYNKDVWLSGGYMRMARVLREHDMDEARNYLEKAKEIIDSNPELTLRQKQWEKLNQTLTQ
jgi:tetratricopeptide (TPR) repeat protein